MKKWAALFDWDGVIVDSSRQHEASWDLLAQEKGYPIAPDSFLRGFGMKNDRVITDVLGWTRDPEEIEDLSNRKEVLYREIVRTNGISPLPGVASFLKTLKKLSIPRAIASSTPRLNITTVLEIIGLTDYFDSIIAAEDVSQGKPHPEVFLKAAQSLDFPPAHCVVFEDAHVGIQAAKAAKMKVVAVTTTHHSESLEGADWVVERLDLFDLKLLSNGVE